MQSAYGPYPPPYYYYPPPVAYLPPATLPYEDGDPVPPGYEIKTRAVRSMLIAGATTFGAPYLVSLISAAVIFASDSSGSQIAPLFAPIVGPFITIGTSRAGGPATFWLVVDGLAQTGGAIMFIYGLAAKEKFLKRTPFESSSVPEVILGPSSGALRWTF